MLYAAPADDSTMVNRSMSREQYERAKETADSFNLSLPEYLRRKHHGPLTRMELATGVWRITELENIQRQLALVGDRIKAKEAPLGRLERRESSLRHWMRSPIVDRPRRTQASVDEC